VSFFGFLNLFWSDYLFAGWFAYITSRRFCFLTCLFSCLLVCLFTRLFTRLLARSPLFLLADLLFLIYLAFLFGYFSKAETKTPLASHSNDSSQPKLC